MFSDIYSLIRQAVVNANEAKSQSTDTMSAASHQPLPLLSPPTQAKHQVQPQAQHFENAPSSPTPQKVAAPAPATEKVDNDQFKNIKTQALVVKEPKADFELTPIVLDEVRPDEVLIDMKYSGICHTDIVLQQGLLPMVDFPAIFGHEGGGYVRAIGSNVKDKSLKVGDAVLLSFNTCGDCKPYKTQHPAFCHKHPEVNHNAVRTSDRSTPARLQNGGKSVRSQYFGQSSFSKMSVVNEQCVVKCSSPENMDVYAPIGCGFQTGAGTILNVLKPEKEESIVIFGLGSVGLAALMAAVYRGVSKVIAVDIVEERLKLAQELGATHTVNSKAGGDIPAAIKGVTNGGANFAVDCTGITKVIEDMIESVGPQGTAALVGVPPANAQIKLDPLTFLLQNKKFVGVIEGDSNPPELIPQLIALHKAGKFPIDKLCKTYPVAKLQDAVHDMHSGKVIKPVIDWS